MSHRAALYTVRVKEKWGDHRLLGDIDEAGTHLAVVLEGWLRGFERENEDGSKVVRCTKVTRDDDELAMIMQHGETGVAADIIGPAGDLRLRQKSVDTQLLRCAGLFALPGEYEMGWLVLHVNHNRGVKGLLEAGLLMEFGRSFDDLMLEITPFVDAKALGEAIDAGRLDNIRLVKYERPDDRAVEATNRWVRGGSWGKIVVTISPRGRAERLQTSLLKRFLGEASDERGKLLDEIVEFQGVRYDEAKVEVELENGTHRTFNIEKPSSGHSMTIDLENLGFDDDGEPTEETLLAGIREALAAVR
jgi:hypothetical protein